MVFAGVIDQRRPGGVEQPGFATWGLEQARSLLGDQAAVGTLAQGPVHQQEARRMGSSRGREPGRSISPSTLIVSTIHYDGTVILAVSARTSSRPHIARGNQVSTTSWQLQSLASLGNPPLVEFKRRQSLPRHRHERN